MGRAASTAAVVAAAAAGAALGRASASLQARRALRGNWRILSADERRAARTLVSHGHGYLFRAWPSPGVNDAAKRRLLAAAAAQLGGDAPLLRSLEPDRLDALAPPAAERRPKLLASPHDGPAGPREDPYYWLRDDARADADVLRYLSQENTYCAAAMADTEPLQAALYKEMRGRIQEADVSVAARYRGYYYYTRTEEGQQYAVHCRRPAPPGAGPPGARDAPDEAQPEEVLLDENARKEAGKHAFYMVGAVEVSPDQRLLAWTEDTVGGEKYTLRVKELSTGREVLAAPIPMTAGDVVWANDNATLLYTVKDALDRPYKVLRHTIGEKPAEEGGDAVVYEEADEAFYVGISRSHSDALLYIHSGSAITNEVLFLDADAPAAGPPTAVLPRAKDVEYSVSHHPGGGGTGSSGTGVGGVGGWFVITYRDPSMPNSELRVAPVADPSKHAVLLPHRADVKLEGAGVGAKWLVVSERARAQQAVVLHALPAGGVMPAALGEGRRVEFDEPAYALSGGLTGDFDSEVVRLRYSSLTTPPSVYDEHMPSGERALKKVQPILGGFSRDDYVTERLWAPAPDGVEVPISLAYRKGLAKLDGSDAMLLHGYGSYEYSYDPSFSRDQLALLDRGFVVAVAHIRGGGDMGRAWYEDGKFLKKKNTFTDFIACAEHLVARKYTSPARLTIEGRSAGGLLMGAVTNMRPDLFAAVMMGVPFVDCLTTMLDDTIPLTTIEWEEWGNPNEPQFFDYMRSYSPVDNVAAQPYPNILVTAGLHDPRVGYWEPAKLVAKLRALKTDRNLLLLKTELGAGHFSVTGRFERLKETAFEYAFLLKALGMLEVAPLAGTGGASGAGGEGAGK